MRRILLLSTAILALAICANAQGIALGSAVENFTLLDFDRKVQTLNKLKSRNGTVIVFLSAQCSTVEHIKTGSTRSQPKRRVRA